MQLIAAPASVCGASVALLHLHDARREDKTAAWDYGVCREAFGGIHNDFRGKAARQRDWH
jgi:hypothetical protein